MKRRGHEIVKTTVDNGCVEITLENGVKVLIASNPNTIHVHLSGINLDAGSGGDNIGVAHQCANQLDIKYKPRPA